MDLDPVAWETLRRVLERHAADLPGAPVTRPVALGALLDELAREFPLDAPVALPSLVERVAGVLEQHAVHVTHPRYFGLFNPPVTEAAVLGDTLVAAFNPQLAAWSHAAGAHALEQHTLRVLGDALGLPSERLANFTTGGAEANLSAVLSAIAHRHPETGVEGLASSGPRLALYVSSESHHSFVKIARGAGLGTRAVRELPVGADLRLDPAVVERALDEDVRAGWTPLLVVGTAGTTGAGVVDPLAELADVCARRRVWFHVDAAWGGAAALSPTLRRVLAGIERADSVTWDAHKWLSVPMGAGMFFCRHPEAVRRAFAVTTTYMPAVRAPGADDPYATTVQWSRRAIGIKVFLSLAALGLHGWRRRVEHQAAMGERLSRLLQERGYRRVNDTPLPVVCFDHPDGLDAADVAAKVVASGRAWISPVSLAGRAPVLRACITSFETGPEDLLALVDAVDAARGVGRWPDAPSARPHRSRPRLAFLTDAERPDLTEDDRLAAQALARLGVDVVPWVWTAPAPRGIAAAVVRSTWDYHQRAEEFRAFLDRCERSGPRLWNAPATLRRNLDKAYLLGLAARGIPVVPTLRMQRGDPRPLTALAAEAGWGDVVVKPLVSAGAFETWRARPDEVADARFRSEVTRGDRLVQPFLPELVRSGEWSLLFFDGTFSHAVLKRTAPDDFRVQEEYGGTAEAAEPPEHVVVAAARVLAAANERTLYARVDGVVVAGAFRLLELELLEPSLFLASTAEAPARFAAAAVRWMAEVDGA